MIELSVNAMPVNIPTRPGDEERACADELDRGHELRERGAAAARAR